MEKKRKRRNIILALVLLALAAGMIALPTLLRSAKPEKTDNARVLSARAERARVRTTISGGGSLTDQEGAAVKVLPGVEVTEYLVSDGELVEAGQPVAKVDKVSVMQTIATVQKNLDYLEKQLRRNPGKVTADAIFAPVAGRVKAIYANKGDAASDVMERYGALAVVSLDGLMAMEVETAETVGPGESVTVELPDGKKMPGRVDQRRGNTLVITLSDDGPGLGDAAKAFASDGTELGSGELYVHSAWNVTAATGTVTYIAAAVNKTVGAGGHLFNLDNVDFTAKFKDLSRQHREYETAMAELFVMYEQGVIPAPAAGRVSGVDSEKVGLMRADGQDYALVLLSEGGEEEPPAEPDPTPVPPPPPPSDPNTASPDALTTKSAMVSEVKFGSMTFMVSRDAAKVTSWAAYPSIDYNKCDPSVMTSFSGVTVYDMGSDGQWKKASPSDLNMGDMLYFVYSGEQLLWILRPKAPEIDYGGGGGGWGGYEEPFEMYDLTRKELLQVVPQETMTVEVVVDELDITAVAVGQEAEITVDALPGRAYTGTVQQVDPNGKNNGGNTKYTVTIAIPRDEKMLNGMNATAILTVGVTDEVLTIPAAALTQKGRRTLVYTGYDPETDTLLDPVEVATGVSDGVTVEILEGLEEGKTIYYTYYEANPFAAAAALPSEYT